MAATLSPGAPRLAGLSRRALIVGLTGLAVTAAGALVAREQFFRSYLAAFLFWSGLGLGCLGILLLHSVVGGRWGLTIRRQLEAGARTLPLAGLLFLPLIFGLRDLYPWARPEVVAADELLRHKSLYLNVPFMVGRSIAFFAIWSLIAWRISALSMAMDREGAPDSGRRLRRLAGPMIIVHVLLVTFASVDWIMSLEPHWFSTIFGALTLVGQILAAMAFLVAITVWLASPAADAEAPVRGTIYDLGNLLLAFVMFWAYLAFSQFLIIWAGNLPEEIPWYLKRLTGGWQAVGLGIILFHFFLPFLMLISRGTKGRGGEGGLCHRRGRGSAVCRGAGLHPRGSCCPDLLVGGADDRQATAWFLFSRRSSGSRRCTLPRRSGRRMRSSTFRT